MIALMWWNFISDLVIMFSCVVWVGLCYSYYQTKERYSISKADFNGIIEYKSDEQNVIDRRNYNAHALLKINYVSMLLEYFQFCIKMENNSCSNNYLTLINIKLPETILNTVYVQCSSLDKLLRHQIDRLDYITTTNVWYKSYTFVRFSFIYWMKNRFQYCH